MSISYDYPPANYDAYKTIVDVYPKGDSMDIETKKLCLFFLKRGADRGDKKCLELLEKQKVNYHRISCFPRAI